MGLDQPRPPHRKASALHLLHDCFPQCPNQTSPAILQRSLSTRQQMDIGSQPWVMLPDLWMSQKLGLILTFVTRKQPSLVTQQSGMTQLVAVSVKLIRATTAHSILLCAQTSRLMNKSIVFLPSFLPIA